MARGFYQDELGSSLTKPSAPAAPAFKRPRVQGQDLAVGLHLLVLAGGPAGLVASWVVSRLTRHRLKPPLVRETEAAIWRFSVQIGLVIVASMALILKGQEWAVWVLLGAVLALWTLPALAAFQTWRTARVFRYPVWDLVVRRRR